MKRSIVAALMMGAMLVMGCNNNSSTPKKDTTKAASSSKPTKKPAAATPKGPRHPGLLDPSLAADKAPDSFRAKFYTTKGDFVIEVTRDWAPIGADRFYNLVRVGFFTDVCFFRVIHNFMAQFGISGDPQVSAAWKSAQIQDEPVQQTNARGTLTFAKTNLPNTRATQLFINFKDNARLDKMGFAPLGRVVEGMDVVDALHNGYGGSPSSGQGAIAKQGNSWLRERFPELDYIKRAELLK